MPEWSDALVCGRSRLRVLMGVVRVFEGLPGLFVCREAILFSVLLGDTVGMRGLVTQFVGPLAVFVE